MAFYTNFGAYPQQQQTQAGGCGQQQPFGNSVGQFGGGGLASYGGQPSGYSVNQPAYYAGPSYSTTSDNEFLNQQQQQQLGQSQAIGSSAFGNGFNAYATGYSNNYYGNNSGNFGDQFAAYANQYQQQQPQQQLQSLQQSYVPQTHTSSQTNLAPTQSTQQQQPGDELTQIQPQIEAAYEAATGCRRQPVIKRQVITIPGAPGRVQQIVRRLPTPTPDVVERVFVVKPQRDVVNLIIERPCTPPAQYRDRTIMGKQRKPVINPLIVRVQGRPQCIMPAPQQCQPCQPVQCQQQQQQQQPICYQSQYVQALPAPPILNVQSVRVPPSSSYLASSHHHQYSQQHPVQSASQPSLSQCQQQYQQSSGQLSQHASQSQLQHQLSQPHLAQHQQPGGYVIAPVQYTDQQFAANFQAATAAASAPFGAGYSTGFPLNQNYFGGQQVGGFGGYGASAGGSCF
jgi:hypothetical protein